MIAAPPQVKCDYCNKVEPMISLGIGTHYGSGWQVPLGWVRPEQNIGFAGAGTMPMPDEVDVLIHGRTFCSVDHLGRWAMRETMKGKKEARSGSS
jgi:hypothetical protein